MKVEVKMNVNMKVKLGYLILGVLPNTTKIPVNDYYIFLCRRKK